MRKILLFVAVATLLASCNGTSRQLPAEVDSFVEQLYPDLTMESEVEHDGDYEIHIAGGVEIDCDAQGQWTSVEDPGGVPASIVPAGVKQYVDSVYKGRTIVKIERERQGYDVELYGKINLIFSHDGSFIREDYKIIEVEL